jgi:hypothetical protein
MKKSELRNIIREEIHRLTESNNYYTIAGDPYDGGVDVEVFVNGKRVYKGWRAGDHDWEYKKKKYGHIDKMLDVIAADNHLKSSKEFKRIQK